MPSNTIPATGDRPAPHQPSRHPTPGTTPPADGSMVEGRSNDVATGWLRTPPRRRLRIGVNLLWLVPGQVGGSENYALGLVRALLDLDELQLVLFCQPTLLAAYPELAEANVVTAPGGGHIRGIRLLWENTWLAYQAHHHNLDVIHHLGGTLPPLCPGPSVLTIYDIQPITHPERFDLPKRAWLRATLPRSARHAEIVLTLTDHVRQQILRHLAEPGRRMVVRVTPPGVTPSGPPDATAIDETLRRYGLSWPLLLYPAIAYPHKNHDVLLQALPAVLARHPSTTLVCTGGPHPDDHTIHTRAHQLGIDDAVRSLGRVPRADLDALYDAAAALVFPSTHEGFGIPLLEAIAHGCPILAANTTAIPEVVADHGLLIDPTNPAAWAAAITNLLDHPHQAAHLATASRQGANRYTWNHTAHTTLTAYQAVAAR